MLIWWSIDPGYEAAWVVSCLLYNRRPEYDADRSRTIEDDVLLMA